MNKLALGYSRSVTRIIESAIRGSEAPNSSEELEITIELDDRDLNVRGLASYLELADRVYGRTFDLGLISYALRERAQLRIAETRSGSLIITLADSFYNMVRSEYGSLILLYIFLTYGPAGLKAISETFKNLTDGYKSYEEGRLARVNRKKIADEMKADELLGKLSETQRTELRRMMKLLEKSEKNLMTRAQKFVSRSVRRIRISFRQRPPRN